MNPIDIAVRSPLAQPPTSSTLSPHERPLSRPVVQQIPNVPLPCRNSPSPPTPAHQPNSSFLAKQSSNVEPPVAPLNGEEKVQQLPIGTSPSRSLLKCPVATSRPPLPRTASNIAGTIITTPILHLPKSGPPVATSSLPETPLPDSSSLGANIVPDSSRSLQNDDIVTMSSECDDEACNEDSESIRLPSNTVDDDDDHHIE